MIKLIHAEFKKLLSKKSIYIVTFIFILFAILTNVLYKEMNIYVYEEDINIEEYKEINRNLDLTNEDEAYEYVSNLALIESEELKANYKTNNQKYLLDNYYYYVLYDLYENEYITKDQEEYSRLFNLKNEYLEAIKKDDWEYFNNLEIENKKNNLINASNELARIKAEGLLKLAEYRKTNEISYDTDNYLHNAIDSIENNLVEYYNLKNKENRNNQEEEILKELESDYLKNWYVLDHKVDANNETSLAAVLSNFTNEFGLFILIYVIMISGSMISEEFNKGTIKYLLTKPYKRSTILTAKLLTILIFIPCIILFMALVETILGGFILGFSSLKLPVLIYDATNHILATSPVLIYLLKMILATLPIYLILAILCFMLSTITTSTSAAITITFLFYLLSNVIANLATIYNIKALKVFVSLYWDFSYLVDLSTHPFNVTTGISILVVVLYIIVMLCIAYVYFNKKDVKNI